MRFGDNRHRGCRLYGVTSDPSRQPCRNLVPYVARPRETSPLSGPARHQPQRYSMRIPDDFKNSVCFLCVETGKDSPNAYHYLGTAFFVRIPVNVPSPLGIGVVSFVYLVTARHCVERSAHYGPLKARLNRRNGTSIIVGLPDRWTFHDNDVSDIAVLRIGLPRLSGASEAQQQVVEDVDFRALPPATFATAEVVQREEIGIGDELFIVGLFTGRHGDSRNIPIIRTGVIASMPEEPLVDPGGRTFNAHLVEIRSIGGLSGSPVFVYLPQTRQTQNDRCASTAAPRFLLLGMIRGHWDLHGKGSVDYAIDEDGKINTGIAVVTPFQEIWEVLMNDEYQKQRKKFEANPDDWAPGYSGVES